MADGPIRVGVLFGGRSAEHEVSIRSAKSVLAALDPERFVAVPIGIDREGGWHAHEEAQPLLESGAPVALIREPKLGGSEHRLVRVSDSEPLTSIDVIFPVLHGPFGEDGTVQGLLELASIPYVGSGVLGSAVGMDKDVSKRLLRDAGIPIAPFRVFRNRNIAVDSYVSLVEELGSTLFVKPANLGSSVGVARVTDQNEYAIAVETAFDYDAKIIVEQAISGREIECSVLGNESPIASIPGEIRAAGGFYSYRAKYIDEHGAELVIPAPLERDTADRIRALAIEVFTVLELAGMARVDLFLTPELNLVVNEANTIPGFTSISMYPKLWEASGMPYRELISRLIDLAIERHGQKNQLDTRYHDDDSSSPNR